MSREDLNSIVVSKLALMCCKALKNNHDITEEDIIETIFKYEFTGEYTKTDLEMVINYILNKNYETVLKERGFIGYIKYIAELATHNDDYYNKLRQKVNAYEK